MKLVGLMVMALFFSIATADAYSGDVAIIVNQTNDVDDVSMRTLAKILKQEKQFWKGRKKIYLIMQDAGTKEKNIMLKKVYHMKGAELKRHWLSQLYTEKISSFPKTVSSNEAVKQFVNQVPNAIGYVNAADVDDSVKVLRIDGRLPGEAGYAISD